MNSAGDSESGFLDPLREVVASGKTFADRMLDRYYGPWNGDVSHVYDEYSF
jgi:glutamate--cysteine ligase